MKFRKPLTITSRTSSITNAFVQSIIPCVEPTDEEVDHALAILGMTRDNIVCAYCGDKASDWDHLRPLVRNKRPTGFITELANMVPACGPCNQSKSGQDWRKWMLGNAQNSPKTRGVHDLQIRVKRLETYERWGNVRPIDFRAITGEELWDQHWNRLDEITGLMRAAQEEVASIRVVIEESV